MVCEECAPAQLQVGHDAPEAGEIPLEIDWIHSSPISSVARLEHDKCRYGIDSVLKPPFERAGQMRIRQHPSITQTYVPHRRILGPAGNTAATARPHLNLVPPSLGAIVSFRSLGGGARHKTAPQKSHQQ